MIVYFSGTGNSRYAAEYLALKLNDEVLDAGALLKRGEKGELYSERPYIFVSPTYAWRIPRVFESWLRLSRFAGSKNAYFIMTCGSSIGAADGVLGPLCKGLGLSYQGVLELVMPENYVAMFRVPGAEECARLLRQAEASLDGILMDLVDEKPLPPAKKSPLRRVLTALMPKGFYPLFVKAKGFHVREGCIACGRCEKNCPMNNVRLTEGKPTWGSACTHCMACIGSCPAGVIEYGKKTLGKRRYWNDEHPKNQ